MRDVLPTIDYAFKRVFGTEKNKQCLISFLKAVLGIEILDLTYQNTELGKETAEDKLSRIDVLALLPGNSKIHIEVQIRDHDDIRERLLHYWSTLFYQQFKSGQKIETLHPVVSICVADFSLFQNAHFHSRFLLKNTDTGEPMFSDRQMVDIHFLELSKLKFHKLDLNNPLDRWAAFLKSEDETVLEGLKNMDKIIELALSELELAHMNHDERASYYARRNQIWAHNSSIDTAIRRGTEKGRQDGKAETLSRLAKKRFPNVNEEILNLIMTLTPGQLDEQVEFILDYNSQEEFELAIQKASQV